MRVWLAVLLFVLGAFAANGHALFGWAYPVWLLAGLAAWTFAGAPIPAISAAKPKQQT
jgi:hypothetical protein